MRINKEDSNILRDTAEDIGAYLGRLNEPNTGRLDRATIESMDTELDSNDYAQSKSGTLSGSYVESHSVDIEDIDIASAPIQRRLNQEYYEKHNQSFDEPAIRVNNPTLKPTDSKTELEEDSIVSRIPFDVQVKMAFLEKRTVRCSGTSVFLYKDECGYFEELNETSHIR